MDLDICECFVSFQGEGLWVGRPQVFLRFAGCNLRCRYCDTPDARSVPPRARLQDEPFSGSWRELKNPVPADLLARELRRLLVPGISSLSLTGGEPLLQAEGICALLRELGEACPPIYLETNATLPGELAVLAERVGLACLDVKLESVAGCGRQLENHLACLAPFRPGRAFVKVVLAEGFDPDELEEAALELGALGKARGLVLQPVTPVGEAVKSPSSAELWKAFRLCSRYFTDVRVIPQVHRVMGWL